MAAGKVISPGQSEIPRWIFGWRARKTPWFPKLAALAVAGAAFVFLITMVRIPIKTSGKLAAQKASVIYLLDDGEGRALALKAREGGPFPSRFEPSEWQGFAQMEQAALAAARLQARPYVPEMKDLPLEERIPPIQFAARGELFFPKRAVIPRAVPAAPEWTLAPALYPLTGISAEDFPSELPPFEAAVDAAMSSAAWRFLIRLNPDGGVADCVSLERGDDAGAVLLENWLRQVKFAADPARPARWIGVGIGFINQAADGTNAR